MNLQIECFNFEMFCLESEQSINATLFSENAEMFSLNESENTGNVISRIFDSIAMFIDKIIQQAKKKMATIGFKSAKEKIEKIRQSTKEITSSEEVELKFNNAKFLNKSTISYQTLESLTGIIECTSNGFKWDRGSDFVKKFTENKSIDAKKYAMETFCKDVNINRNDSNKSIQDVINNENETEKIKAKDIRSKVGLVETQLKELDEFITKDFKGCLDELIKIRNDMRKKSSILKTASANLRIGVAFLFICGMISLPLCFAATSDIFCHLSTFLLLSFSFSFTTHLFISTGVISYTPSSTAF